MNERDFLITNYRQQYDMTAMHLSDFSEAEMLVRPVENANHAAWHVGHLAASLTGLINGVSPGSIPQLPAEFMDRHGGKGAKLDAGFDSKDQLLARFKQANEAAIVWVRQLTQEQMKQPTAPQLHGWVPTVGNLACALPPHSNMHIGQIQVIRRKLGKPVLF